MAFRQYTKVTSKVTGPGIKVASNDGMALSKALKTAQQLYSASRINSKYKGVLTSLAGRLNSQIEAAIVRELGGGQITAGKGGFYPDFYIELKNERGEGTGVFEAREQKLVSTREVTQGTNAGKVFRDGKVSLAGGSGITLSPGQQDLSTGFNFDAFGENATSQMTPTSRFIGQLKAAEGDPVKLLKILDGKGEAAKIIKKGLALKASAIDIPVQFNGRLENRTIRFSWPEIRKCVLAKKMVISVKDAGDGQIKLNLFFKQAIINKALNDMSQVTIKALEGGLGKAILQALSEVSMLPHGSTQAELQKFLKDKNLTYAMEYIKGSARIASGIVKVDKPKKQKAIGSARQSFISGVQLSALVQKRLEATMDKVGNPDPPQLKYRSGRFVSSVQVFPNYKRGLMKYAFNPIYRSLENYGYTPDSQVITSIRQVVTSLYSRQFNIVRAV
mgnify:FL=1